MANESDNWDNYIQEVSNLVENREKYQKRLGQIALDVRNKYGGEALVGLAEDVANTTGHKVSVRTLRNYAWVTKKLQGYELPEDITYRTMQALASTENPQEWIDRMLKEGLSSADVFRQIREGSSPRKPKTFICENCGAENSIS